MRRVGLVAVCVMYSLNPLTHFGMGSFFDTHERFSIPTCWTLELWLTLSDEEM
jgi:hypothetical protein